MRETARTLFGNETEFLIGVNGSYARREATKGSDIDCFFLATKTNAVRLTEKQTAFHHRVKEDLKLKLPASEGVFETPLPVDTICKIGGQNDDNITLTRRMLLLLEGEWVFNESAFRKVRNILLEKYLYDRPGKGKICMFLLNDIIRYWRTICIDLEQKIYHGNKARPIRLIKLRFSRMLLYASGVLTIGQGYGLSYENKIGSLSELFGKYPIGRIQSVVGEKAVPVLELYAEFLKALDMPHIRDSLEDEGRNSQAFEDMSNKARQFRDNLHCLFQTHFADDNPTIRALLL